MSHEVHPTLSPYHADIYEALREAWFWFGAAPSQYELQTACRCSSTTVQQAFRELRKRGLILAPKFSTRSAKPTDMSRTISTAPRDPWGELSTDKPKFWVLPEDQKHG